MDRIEYEYPLFQVFYSNNSNNSNIRGNPGFLPSLLCLGLSRREIRKILLKNANKKYGMVEVNWIEDGNWKLEVGETNTAAQKLLGMYSCNISDKIARVP